jgi:outer membrane protein
MYSKHLKKRFKIISNINISLIILIAFNLSAQPVKILTYEEIINIALNRSYMVKSFQLNKLAMQRYFDFRKAMFKPRLDFSLNVPSWNERVYPIEVTDGLPVYNSTGIIQYGGNLQFTYVIPSGGHFALSATMYQENLRRVLAMQDYKQIESFQGYSSLALSFSQPILTSNTLKQDLNEAKYQYERSSSFYTRGQMDIIYDVTRNFYQLYQAARQVEIEQERLTNVNEAYRIARLKGETGRIPEVEVLIAEISVAQAKAGVSESIGVLEREKDSFKQVISIPLSKNVQITTEIAYDTFDIDLDQAIEEALKYRLEINEHRLDIELQKIRVDRAKQIRKLKGNIYAYYDLTGVSTLVSRNTMDLLNSSFDNFIERPPNRGINLTFSFPVLDWGRGAAQVEQARAQLEESQLSLENRKIQIEKEVRDVVRKVREALNRLRINEDTQELAKRSYAINVMRFENGDITSQELGREQERLSAAQIDFLNAYITYQLTANDLKRKTMWDFKHQRSYLKEEYFAESDGYF